MNNTEKPLKKFTIRMQRNQIAEVDIEVEATNDMEAIDKAMELAEDCVDANGFSLDWDEVDYNFEAIDVETDEDDEDEVE
ncbi:MAG: hypothetical protein EBR82_85045 [Caulobacteraceae bacterium]|nr:hypothetical protein [Caulobacteraceae bacterium]